MGAAGQFDGPQQPKQQPGPPVHLHSVPAHGAASQSPHPQQQPLQQQTPQQTSQQQQVASQQPLSNPHSQQRSVKRPRPVKSCTECRKRKLRCDRLCPCSQCQKSNRACKYAADADGQPESDASDVEVSEPGRPPKRNCPPGTTPSATSNVGDLSSLAAVAAAAKNGDASGLPLLEELSLRMERLEKQVLVRSPAVTDLSAGRVVAATADTIRGLSVKNGAKRTRFFGQGSSRIIFNLFDDAKAFIHQHRTIAGGREVLSDFRAAHHFLHDHYAKALTPISVYVDSMMPIQKRMTDILPPKSTCDRLVASYVDSSETIYRILHIPSFMDQYNLYWSGRQQSEFFLPQLLAVLSTASRFETKSKGILHERVEGVHNPTSCALIRSWLDSLKGKQRVEFESLQVEVLLLHAQRMVTQRTNELWAQLGYVVRNAMSMGLHRDSSEFGPRMTIFQGELRRRLWYTIMDMDVHLSIALNMPTTMREGDFTCRPPRNLDDVELFEGMRELPPTKPIDQVTDNQLQVYGAMTLPARMKVAYLVNNIDSIRDYQEVLDVGIKLDGFLEDINHLFPRQGILNDTQKNKMWRSRVILDMHVRRPLLALYRSLAMGTPDAPSQITRAHLRSSMVILKYLDEIDPRHSFFDIIAAMYHQMLKHDIVQAALSVCYYIQLSHRSVDNMMGGHPGQSPEYGGDNYPQYKPEKLSIWSPERLISTVEKSIEILIRHASGNDTKDLLTLALVLESVRKPDPRAEEIVHGLYGVLDLLLRSANTTLDKVRSVSPREAFSPDGYMHGHPQMSNPAAAAQYFGGWLIWDGWD
ncbi:Zn2Cys6 transcription factor [Cordyceps fumosorosea ARSEF 2679]|uniref:Zn2Cys6 transcription factor n=1 Tax=Cordyceps fumosorosea (strain ARSEF 2679) TaxID=1081104 RepID=A0A167M6Q5_CORFA|nr:Zn2Cys6 transcription factor [Cordyceps fumosorosea ARSEF 2679]OAA54004.1 Zn2Cys6 transcription factor [Cordyceps fumosorosea ARSEF 2679]